MKKWLKICLIILWFLIILRLTFVLTNKKFGFGTLERTHCWPDKKYDWKDEECYKKCINWCSSYRNCPEIMNALLCVKLLSMKIVYQNAKI